ncbi:MAG: response regulator [Bdellovibrionales bacterium]|nr:response regulator [Bdellovibrionales bacterium]
MKITKVLLIEDEGSIRRFLKISLESASMQVLEAATGHEGLSLAASHKPDMIILDIGLPDMSGFELLPKLREWYSRPIIVLTVHDQEEEKVKALDLGADDYLTKPFGVPELMARIRASLRRSQSEVSSEPVFTIGDFQFDRSAHIVRVKGQEVHLTSTEYNLLAVLVKHSGKVVTHRMLLNEVWGPNSIEHVQYLRVYMGQIRKKLKQGDSLKEIISTEPGVGYRLLTD